MGTKISKPTKSDNFEKDPDDCKYVQYEKKIVIVRQGTLFMENLSRIKNLSKMDLYQSSVKVNVLVSLPDSKIFGITSNNNNNRKILFDCTLFNKNVAKRTIPDVSFGNPIAVASGFRKNIVVWETIISKHKEFYKLLSFDENGTMSSYDVKCNLDVEFKIVTLICLVDEIVFFVSADEKFFSVSTRDGINLQYSTYDHLCSLVKGLRNVRLLYETKEENENKFFFGGLNTYDNLVIVYSDGREDILFPRLTILHDTFHSGIIRFCYEDNILTIVVESLTKDVLYYQQWKVIIGKTRRWVLIKQTKIINDISDNHLYRMNTYQGVVFMHYKDNNMHRGSCDVLRLWDGKDGKEDKYIRMDYYCLLNDYDEWKKDMLDDISKVLTNLSRALVGIIVEYVDFEKT